MAPHVKLNSHFFPALIKKIYLASKTKKKKVIIWGTGKPKRELLYVEDFADAVLYFLNKNIKQPFLNIGIFARLAYERFKARSEI